MRCSAPCSVVAVLVSFLTLPTLVHSQDAKPINIELKDFKFTEQSDLLGYNDGDDKLFFYINGTIEAKMKIPADGDYEVTIKASGDPAMNERARFRMSIDGQPVGEEPTVLTADEARDYKLPAKLKAGEHKIAFEYDNDVYKENEYDRNFYVHAVSIAKRGAANFAGTWKWSPEKIAIALADGRSQSVIVTIENGNIATIVRVDSKAETTAARAPWESFHDGLLIQGNPRVRIWAGAKADEITMESEVPNAAKSEASPTRIVLTRVPDQKISPEASSRPVPMSWLRETIEADGKTNPMPPVTKK